MAQARGIRILTWHRPQVDMFATRFNCKLTKYVSTFPDPNTWTVDALSVSWEDLDMYVFPPVSLLDKVISKLSDNLSQRVILIAPGWPNMPWFWDMVDLSSDTHLSPKPTRSRDSALQWSSLQGSSQSQPSCLATRAETIKEQGFSSPVALCIEAPQRCSTRTVYEVKWSVFVRWIFSCIFSRRRIFSLIPSMVTGPLLQTNWAIAP